MVLSYLRRTLGAVKSELAAHRAFPRARYINSARVSTLAEIGEDVGIGDDVVVNPGVRIGAYSYVNRGAMILSGTIGRYCSIAHYVYIGGENHAMNMLSTSPRVHGLGGAVPNLEFQAAESAAPPVIGHDVWIGAHAIVMRGVEIGNGAVVGAGSVVTRHVPSYGIVVGSPARVIGYRFESAVIERLLATNWWEARPDSDVVAELAALGPDIAHMEEPEMNS